jgi:hypothetical protein
MTTVPLLVKLRRVGVVVSAKAGRLILDAPAGVITAELRRELADRKTEIITALLAESVRPDQDSALTEARHVVADLLATAYQRYSAPRRAGSDQRKDSGDGELANSSVSSVHGVVP